MRIDGVVRNKGRRVLQKTEDAARRMNYYLLYTIIFIVMSSLVFSFFFLNGKSLVTKWDGLSQHFNALGYYGQWLRKIVRGILFEHKFEIPMWDLSIGYGADIITTLHYYVIGDPLDLLAIGVPIRYTEYLYEFLIVLRVYLAGLAFSYYAKSHGNGKSATIIGSLVYCFCGYVLVAAVRHPYFTNPMIYYPMILVGADRILEKKKPGLFIGMLGIACISNFYFAYMICALTVLYVVIRYFSMQESFQLKAALGMCMKFVFFALIGVAMAGVLMIPVINVLMSTHRMGASNNILTVYPLQYYIKLFSNFATSNNDYWTCMGLSAISIIAVILLFMKKKQNKELKIAFVIMTAMLMIPYVGHVMNGFSYVSNRWCWGYAALVAYIVVKTIPDLVKVTGKEVKTISICVVAYLVICMVSHIARDEHNMLNGVIMVVFCLFLAAAVLYQNMRKYIKHVAFALTAGTIFLNAFYMYGLQNENYIHEYVDSGQPYKKLTTNLPSDMVEEQNDKVVSRYDQIGSNKCDNTAMQNGLYGTDFYFSLNNGYISQYLDEMYLNIGIEDTYTNLDGRTIMSALASVKYFILPDNLKAYLPYLYKEKSIDSVELENVERIESATGLALDSEGKGGVDAKTGTVTVPSTVFNLYKAKNPLAMGYTYDSYISREEYDEMSVTDKQEALLQGVVLEESNVKKASLTLKNKEVPYTIDTEGDVTVKDGEIQVNSKNATVTIKTNGLKKSETYLIFDQLKFQSLNPLSAYNDKYWDALSRYKKEEEKLKYQDWESVFNYTGNMIVTADEVEKKLVCYTSDYNFYSGKTNYLVNLGYRDQKVNEITLTFREPGKYTFEKMSVVCQPMKNISSNIKKLNKEHLTNVKVKTNKITGKITCDNDKVLCMSIPYSDGWSAYVDGKKTEVKQANTMYLAIELEKGEHKVEFKYQTPQLKLGGIVSCLGIIMYVVVLFVYKRKERHESTLN